MQEISHRGETSPAFLAPSSGLCQLLLSLAYKSLFPTSEGQLATEWKVAVIQQPTATLHTSFLGGTWRTLSVQRRLPGDLGQLNGDRAAGIWPEQSPVLLQNQDKLKTPQDKVSPLLLPAEQVPLPQLCRSAPGSRAGIPSCPPLLWTVVMMRATKQLLQRDHSC